MPYNIEGDLPSIIIISLSVTEDIPIPIISFWSTILKYLRFNLRKILIDNSPWKYTMPGWL
jgi:hypothetical protein